MMSLSSCCLPETKYQLAAYQLVGAVLLTISATRRNLQLLLTPLNRIIDRPVQHCHLLSRMLLSILKDLANERKQMFDKN